MKKGLFALLLTTLLCGCGSKDYEYADQLFDFYDDILEHYEDAETLEELEKERAEAFKLYAKIEEEQKESHNELVKDIEAYDEDAYLLHLNLLTAESHAQWLYNKRKMELTKENK